MENKKIGQAIVERRGKLNLTQTMLAEKLHVSPKTISKWESGRGLPSIDILPELSRTLGITIDELLGNEPEVKAENLPAKEFDEYEIARFMSPKYVKFTEPINSILERDWLKHLLKLEGVTMNEFYNLVSSKKESQNKPKSIKDCVDRLFEIQTVTIGQVQRALKIGFSKAAKIRDLMVKNCLLDKDFFTWKNRDRKQLQEILEKEPQLALFKADQNKKKEACEIKKQEEVDFEKIELINENISKEEKLRLINLLKECSPNRRFPIESVVCCLDIENLAKILSKTNNKLNVVKYDIKSLEDFQEEVKIGKAERAFVVIEACESETIEILNLLTLCHFEIETEISLKINKDLDKSYKITVFYA